MARRLMALLLLYSAQAVAQPSTDRLRSVRRTYVLEAAAGFEANAGSTGDYYGAAPQRARAARLAVDWQLDTRIGVRVMGWWIQRGAGDDRFGSSAKLIATMLNADFLLDVVPGKFTIAPTVGFGVAPWIKNKSWSPTGADGQSQTFSSSSTGKVWSAGVAIRIQHLVIEQSIVGLIGGDIFVGHEYYPLMVGVRF